MRLLCFLIRKGTRTNKAFLKNNKGSTLVSVIVASAIGIIVILGISTGMVNLATSQKEIQTANHKLWKFIQAQSIVDRFAKKDDSKNTEPTNECLAVLNDKVTNKPTGYEFKSRACNSAMDLGVDCSSNKIIYLDRTTTGGTTGTLPEEWQDWTLPVLPSQCCSLFYENIITLADGKPDIPSNIQTKIASLPTNSSREIKVKEAVHLIIGQDLAYPNTICGDAHAGGGGGADLDCYHVVEDPTDPEYGKTRVGCPKKGETVTNIPKRRSLPTIFGFNAGVNNTWRFDILPRTGVYNTFIGNHAGFSNTSGHSNTFIGHEAGEYNTTGNFNTFIGHEAGFINTTGQQNTFMGFKAGTYNTTGNFNTFIGYIAGKDNTTGYQNTFMGYIAGSDNTTGNNNTFIGHIAGRRNTKGKHNTFIGTGAGEYNTTGNFNTFMGLYAGRHNTTGYRNTFIGHRAGFYNTTGHNNIFMGNYAGYSNTTGKYKLDIGGLIKGILPKRDTIGNIINTAGHSPEVTIRGNLNVTKDLNVTGTTTNTSDRRLKTKIQSLTKNLSKFLKLEPKTYFWKDKSISKKKQFGLIAQDVKKQYPELVSEDDKKFLNLNYIGIIPIIISAFKEFYGFVTNSLNSLTTQIADLKKALQKEVSSLKKDNQQLKKEIKDSKTFQRDLKVIVSKTTKDSTALQKEVSSLKKDNQQLKKEIKDSKTFQRDLKVIVSKTTKDSTALQKEVSSLKKDNEQLKKAFQRDLKVIVSKTTKDSTALQKEVSSLKKDNEQLKKAFQRDLKVIVSKTTKDSTALQKEVSSLKKDNQQLFKDNQQFKKDNQQFKKRMKALEKAFALK